MGKDEADAEDEEELTAVMKRLQDAKPPPAVLKVPMLHCTCAYAAPVAHGLSGCAKTVALRPCWQQAF